VDGLLIAAADAFSWFSPASWLAILKVVLGLGAVIFVHELGHFLVAKACGVKCEKFYLGFDAFDIRIGDFVLVPRRLFHFQWGETEYGIGIIPLGGYVKMLGQDDNPANAARERERSMKLAEEQGDDSKDGESGADSASEAPYELDPRSYQAKSVPQRMAIISAGVIMNMIFAVIFAATAYMIGAPYEPCVIGNVLPGGPAWVEDVQPGSEVVQIGEDGGAPRALALSTRLGKRHRIQWREARHSSIHARSWRRRSCGRRSCGRCGEGIHVATADRSSRVPWG
jgi:regulator of sigma E protease